MKFSVSNASISRQVRTRRSSSTSALRRGLEARRGSDVAVAGPVTPTLPVGRPGDTQVG